MKLALLSFISLVLSSSLALAADAPAIEEGYETVTCASAIKLGNPISGFKLHSHGVAYGSGSGQQSVTGFSASDDSNSLWIVRPAVGKTCKRGEPVPCGSTLRLQHMNTKNYLHRYAYQHYTRRVECSRFEIYVDQKLMSYACFPPLASTRGQRLLRPGRRYVFAYQNCSSTFSLPTFAPNSVNPPNPSGDNWKLVCVNIKQTHWQREEDIRLHHVVTGTWLVVSTKHSYSHPIPGQLEVSAAKSKNAESLWAAQEGIYFAPSQ
ncbi:MIR motif-containing protein [Jimgerdemannia flammicorona]|uniref:MIR motif-containing protein n=1 Tax=Jimgerdemannia flammicorona TaxID=994334 RepID=A0A433Q6S0_9FUNG|nr:MIR motif-containing protein [Jimgerdemannia flammicorona]